MVTLGNAVETAGFLLFCAGAEVTEKNINRYINFFIGADFAEYGLLSTKRLQIRIYYTAVLLKPYGAYFKL